MLTLIELVTEYRRSESETQKQQVAQCIVLEMWPSLWWQAARVVGQEMADDICIEGLQAIFTNLPMFYGETDAQIWSWCRTVVRNKAISHVRKEKRNPVVSMEIEALQRVIEATTTHEPLASEEREELDEAIQRLKSLKPPCFDYLWSRYILDMAIKEIAELFNVEYDAARMRIERCLAQAFKLLTNQSPV